MSERLFNLLPAVYRISDAYQGDALRGLMAVLESEYENLEEDVAKLYGNWFIETCEDWAAPYIADLFGLQGISSSGNASMRAFVGNTIAYRRRKGTPQVLEEVAHDLLNRPVRVQEFFLLLAHTQHLNHLRLERYGTCIIQKPDITRRVATAFDAAMHSVDVRTPRYNLPNIGLSVFRIQDCFIEGATAFQVSPGCFTFDPFGRDLPVFNRERTQFNEFEPVLEADVPKPLERWPLEEELRQIVEAITSGKPVEDVDGVYFGKQPVFSLFVNSGNTAVETKDICIADLRNQPTKKWRRPAGTKVAVDPLIGRITTAPGAADSMKVNYSYGSPGEIGGGPYFRKPADEEDDDWKKVTVEDTGTLAKALQDCRDAGWPQARVIIDSNRTFTENLKIEGQEIQLIAADGRRPCLIGNIDVQAPKAAIRGLWIQGQITTTKKVVDLAITHCSVFLKDPKAVVPSLSASNVKDTLTIAIECCMLGPCSLSTDAQCCTITDSIIQGYGGTAIDGPSKPGAPSLSISRCTVYGAINAKEMNLSESIVTGKIDVERTQSGCARFSWITPGSRTPRRYRCQPDMEIERMLAVAGKGKWSDYELTATIATRPRFQSSTPGNPAYGQLGLGCPDEVRYGAEDEGEMGAWHLLYEQERFQNLRAAIGEYVRFGLAYGVIERS